MPSVRGILMSVTTTSYNALSSLFFAASPELTVSTLWPSRRRAMSSISQMERSSSQTRMLPTRFSYHGDGSRDISGRFGACMPIGGDLHQTQILRGDHAAQPQNEDATLPRLGAGPHLAFVGLHDLVNDGQSQSRATLELRLERFENLVDDLRVNAGTGVGEIDLPVITDCLDRNTKGATAMHGANRIFGEIPEHLFDFVPIGQSQRFLHSEVALDANASILRY